MNLFEFFASNFIKQVSLTSCQSEFSFCLMSLFQNFLKFFNHFLNDWFQFVEVCSSFLRNILSELFELTDDRFQMINSAAIMNISTIALIDIAWEARWSAFRVWANFPGWIVTCALDVMQIDFLHQRYKKVLSRKKEFEINNTYLLFWSIKSIKIDW